MAHTTESRARALAKVNQRRIDWINENGPCVECGSWENLEVDHIDPSLKFTHRIWSYSEVRRSEELSKCQVLCRYHHKLKTSEQNGWRYDECGRRAKYQLGCRCDKCRAAQATFIREQRLRRKNALVV